MKKLNIKEALWLFVPCVIPIVVLALPLLRSALFPKFQPVVDEVHFAKTWNRTSDPDMRGYLVTIYINHTGPRPKWWGNKEGFSKTDDFPSGSYIRSTGLKISDLVNPRFVDAQGKTYRRLSMGIMPNLYDAGSQRYVVHCDPHVSKDFKIENSRFVAGVKTVSGTYKVDTIVKLSPPLR